MPYTKYAWIIFFVNGLLVAAGVALAFTGQLLGVVHGSMPLAVVGLGIGFGIFAMAIAAVPFRRGEKWAWYVSWTWPVLFGFNTVSFFPDPGWQIDFSLIFVLSAALLISLRDFFPRQAP